MEREDAEVMASGSTRRAQGTIRRDFKSVARGIIICMAGFLYVEK